MEYKLTYCAILLKISKNLIEKEIANVFLYYVDCSSKHLPRGGMTLGRAARYCIRYAVSFSIFSMLNPSPSSSKH